MPDPKKTTRRSTVVVILIATGIFLLGAGLIPLLVNAQQNALAGIDPFLSPSVKDFPAPQLELTDLNGNAVSLADYSGQVVLVNNWATWCPPCKSEMPELQAYYAAHASQGFVVVAIESGESADQVASFVQENGMTFPVWLDLQGKALDMFQNWDLPSSYVIDREGVVRLSWTGGVTRPTLDQFVTPLLKENK